jgi:hypothetical protein
MRQTSGKGVKMDGHAAHMENYEDLRRLSKEIAVSVGPPIFLTEKSAVIEMSRKAFEENSMVGECLAIVAGEGFPAGHGAAHIRNVAIDAGAIILIEAVGLPPHCRTGERLSFLAHIAGVLHDIKRSQPDHARLGAMEAQRILEGFELDSAEQQMIVQAIANHEAFQPLQEIARPDAQLLSDALYDADKFRWGPENFTDTLWAMLAMRKTENVPALLERFPRSMEGIERIRYTFRTPTGKTYGPDFIDRGIEIGRRLYAQYMAVQK